MSRFALLFFVLMSTGAFAQPELTVQKADLESQLRFLASDELQGRRTGSPGNTIAARFIAEHLRSYGYQMAPGMESYFQAIEFEAGLPPASAGLTVGNTPYKFGEDFVLMAGNAVHLDKGEGIFAGHGWVDPESGHDDYAGKEVSGKVVFVLSGRPDIADPQAAFQAMDAKRKFASERGAAALIELYRLPFPWGFFSRYVGGETLRLSSGAGESGDSMVYGWLKEKEGSSAFKEPNTIKKLKVALHTSGYVRRKILSQNVIGILEGSDPELKNEYVLLTAHFDHVGVGRQGGGVTTPKDSIFNGARDNAMGTVALLTAARSLALEKPKRSILVVAVTGEELGLLGSSYYAEHPVIPLNQVIFNLNTDGAGYNDVHSISVIGSGRTGTDDFIGQGAAAAGLNVLPDPAPEQNLFDRSDNVSFAVKGIPCVTLSPGFTSFNDEIGKYYHQVSDEADSVDMDYLVKYCQAYAHVARLIANAASKPLWKEGDKYEKAGKTLYGQK